MLVHFRLTSPADLTDEVRDVLVGHDWITNVTVQRGVVVQPAGDLVGCDAAREKAGEILERLSAGLERRGGIVITTPTGTPFIVALLAGAVGALALAIAKPTALVGVFISVTTVPAAGNLALGLAFLDRGEILGSLQQLGLDVGGLFASGAVVLVLMQVLWPRLAARSERLFGVRAPRGADQLPEDAAR